MAKQTFTTGQVLTAAQMTSLQQTAMGGGSPSTKTASYVLVAADAGTVIQMNSASATTITVNTSLFSAGDSVQIQNIGSGTTTITAGTATVNSAGSLAVTQYDGGFLYFSSASSAIWFDYTQPGTTSPLTTKGDLYTRTSSADARLAVGTNGQTLVADSSTATGLKWDTPASGGANFTLLNSGGTNLTGAATVTVSGISGANKILILIAGASSANASATIRIRFNTDSGNNYATNAIYNDIGTALQVSSFSYINTQATDSFNIATIRNNDAGTMSGYLLADGCNSSGLKIATFAGSGGEGSATGGTQVVGGGWYSGSSTISSISVNSSTGNLDAGKVYVYTSA